MSVKTSRSMDSERQRPTNTINIKDITPRFAKLSCIILLNSFSPCICDAPMVGRGINSYYTKVMLK